ALLSSFYFCFFFQAEDGIRDRNVTGVQTCALPIYVAFQGITWFLRCKYKNSILFTNCFLLVFGKVLEIFVLQRLPKFIKNIHERSEEHTSELQSRFDLVCRLLLEKKKCNKEDKRDI